MKEKPIIFSTPMVQEILAGRKTQTRRVIKPQPLFKTHRKFVFADETCPKKWEDCEYFEGTAPYQPGDIMWVRETWTLMEPKNNEGPPFYLFKADEPDCKNSPWFSRWRSSIHMPRDAARIFLRVTDVSAERLQDISGHDVFKEGINPVWYNGEPQRWEESQRRAYKELWDSINAKRGYSWESNPWVFAYEFERL